MPTFEQLAEEFFSARFPDASPYERAKMARDWVTKEAKATGLVADFKRRVGDPRGKKVLDVGFGNGLILGTFIKEGAIGYGLEIDDLLLKVATFNIGERGLTADLKLYDGKKFPHPDNFFDYAYSSSVLEHATYQAEVLKEVYRVLKPGGKFYLAFPNKFTLKETHTGVYFVSMLPRFISDRILKMLKKAPFERYNLHFLSYFGLKKMLRTNNIPLRILFETDSPSFLKRTLKKTLAFFGMHQSALLGHIMVVLQK